MKWELDYDALKKACNTLNVKKPVKYRLQKNLRRYGQCSCETGFYRITILRTLDAQFASKVLWHELTHASQFERYGFSLFYKIYNIDLKQLKRSKPEHFRHDRYNHIPFEAECKANEELFKNRLLVRTLR